VRAETDFRMKSYIRKFDFLGKLYHVRDTCEVNSKVTVRPNRDTICSWGAFDLGSP
jgi:hypothetical protein